MMKALKRRFGNYHASTGLRGTLNQQDFFAFARQKRPGHQRIDAAADNQVVDLPQNLRPRYERHSPDWTASAAFNFQWCNNQNSAFDGQFV